MWLVVLAVLALSACSASSSSSDDGRAADAAADGADRALDDASADDPAAPDAPADPEVSGDDATPPEVSPEPAPETAEADASPDPDTAEPDLYRFPEDCVYGKTYRTYCPCDEEAGDRICCAGSEDSVFSCWEDEWEYVHDAYCGMYNSIPRCPPPPCPRDTPFPCECEWGDECCYDRGGENAVFLCSQYGWWSRWEARTCDDFPGLPDCPSEE